MTWGALKCKLRKNGLRVRLKEARRLFATALREGGIPQELIDLLQWRLPASVFARHYYRPDMAEAGRRVLRLLEPLEGKILG